MSTEVKNYLGLDPKLIEMYQALSTKDKKNLGLLYHSQIGVEPKSLRNLISSPDKFQPSYEERVFLTEEITKRYKAAFEVDVPVENVAVPISFNDMGDFLKFKYGLGKGIQLRKAAAPI